MGTRRARIAGLLLVLSLCGEPAGAAEVIAKDRFLLGSYLGYARLVLSLRPPHARYESSRLDPRLREAVRTLLPDAPVPLAEATHSAILELNFVDPKEPVPGEHVPYVVVTLAVRHQETGEEQRLLLLPAMTPFYQYGGLLRLPRPGPYEFTLTLDPLAIPGVREPTPVTFRYHYEWAGPGGGGTR